MEENIHKRSELFSDQSLTEAALPGLQSVLSNLSSEPALSQDWDTGTTPGPITGPEETAGGKFDQSVARRF